MANPRIAFIGAGNIARAIIGGLIESGFEPASIIAVDPAEDQRSRLPAGVIAAPDAAGMLDDVAAVMLCVKPGLIGTVVSSMAAELAGKLVISVAAGIPIETIRAPLPDDTAVVRCMPNTPALIRAGMTGLYASPEVDADQRALAEQIMRAAGDVVWLENESEIDIVTAISGSGPAYYFLVMEAMEAAGERLGFSAEASRRLVLQTALGAAQMAAASSEDPATLRQNVTSPGGTTEAAIKTLIERGLTDAFEAAMKAARDRSIELGAKSDQAL